MRTKPEYSAQVFNEIGPLKEMIVWGEPSCEALLGQLLPKSQSLFLNYYEVPEARQEFRRMQVLIEGQGIKVTRAKDAFARLLGDKPIRNLPGTLKDLESQMLRKADEYFESYQLDKIQEIANQRAQNNAEDIFLQVKIDIKRVLQEDAEAYGESSAIRLNYVLSLSQELPIANIFYGRDQANALGDQIVLSSMRWKIRKPEIGIYKEALIELGYQGVLVEVAQGTAEGGDMMMFGDTCYIGVGSRTSLPGVKDIYKKIGTKLEEQGIQFVAIVNERHELESAALSSPTEEQMPVMHLDMFWMPLGRDLAMAYGTEVDARKIMHFRANKGEIIIEEGGSFRDYLANRHIQLMEVTAQEQKDYATNLLNLGNDRVIVSLSKNQRVIAELQRLGYQVFEAELNKLVGGYGAIHCLTAPIRRDKPS
jgi:arginine deiminase